MDVKQASFSILILLVSISALYTWAYSEAPDELKEKMTVSSSSDYSASNLTTIAEEFKQAANHLITTSFLEEILTLLQPLVEFFGAIWGLVATIGFGWISLVESIFKSVNLGSLALVFEAPLLTLQIMGALYFIRDIVNTVRGAG